MVLPGPPLVVRHLRGSSVRPGGLSPIGPLRSSSVDPPVADEARCKVVRFFTLSLSPLFPPKRNRVGVTDRTSSPTKIAPCFSSIYLIFARFSDLSRSHLIGFLCVPPLPPTLLETATSRRPKHPHLYRTHIFSKKIHHGVPRTSSPPSSVPPSINFQTHSPCRGAPPPPDRSTGIVSVAHPSMLTGI